MPAGSNLLIDVMITFFYARYRGCGRRWKLSLAHYNYTQMVALVLQNEPKCELVGNLCHTKLDKSVKKNFRLIIIG